MGSVAKVPCALAIRTAKAVTREVPAARETSFGALAKCTEKNSERDTHRLTSKYRLALPIKLSEVELAAGKVHYFKMSSWVDFILEYNLWHLLAGLEAPDHDKCSRIWASFWNNYKDIDPGHEVFQRGIDLSRTAALLLHGDGGRSHRKSEIMVFSAHSALGFGLSTSNWPTTADMKLNYGRSSWTTRYLLAVLPKACYNKDNDTTVAVFQHLLQVLSDDLRTLLDGVKDREGRTFQFAVLKIKGDWPFIQKAGHLGRSFMNAAKHQTSSKPLKGICHLCRADLDVPWEDLRLKARAWKATVNTADPFTQTPALLTLPHNKSDPASFFSYDLFHAWHIGLGKHFLGSAIVVLAMGKAYEGTIPDRLEALSNRFLSWCSAMKVRPMVKGFTKDKLSWLSTKHFPTGHWVKGGVTTNVMRWLEVECKRIKPLLREDRLFHVTAAAAEAMNFFLSGLYKHNLWIPPAEGTRLASYGRRFLQLYGEAVRLSFESKRALFSLQPNLHRIDHLVSDMEDQAAKNAYCCNPLIWATQMDEDFVGRGARVSRRVSAQKVILRTLQRGLQNCHTEYVNQGILIPDPA